MINFFTGDEKFNLSYIIKYVKDLLIASGLIIISSRLKYVDIPVKDSSIKDNIMIIFRATYVLSWIYFFMIVIQFLFVLFKEYKEKNILKD